MVPDSSELAARAAEWAGHGFDEGRAALLEDFAAWLIAEAMPAGGLGPREGGRLWGRHIADSLTFASAWEVPPLEILDVGSGVGLPGIPLAILWPETEVTLLDRGGRRIRLLRRAIQVLGLTNVHFAQGDVFDVADTWVGITFRGSVKPPEAVGLSARMLVPGGVSVVGLSRREDPPERGRDLIGVAEALGLAARIERVPSEVLDGAAWLLIMTAGE